MAVLFFGLCAFFALTAVHPFVTYPLSLRLIRRRHPLPPSFEAAARQESYALCVCAYNEEAVIARKVENMLALRSVLPGLEILVYVDASSDRTAEILKNYAADIHVYVSQHRHGKTHGMNFLVSQAKESILIFSDANVFIDPASLKALPNYFMDPRVGCVCGHLQYTGAEASATAANGSLYWRLEEHIKQLESETGSVMGADGSIFAIRRNLHRPPPDDVIDDMYVSFNILCDGYRVIRAPDIIAREEVITSPHEEFKRKIRIACQAFNVHRMLWPRLSRLGLLDRYKYISHKFLRWMTVYFLFCAVLCFEAGLIAADYWRTSILLVGVVCFLAYAFKGQPRIHQILDILGAFAATGIGVLRSLRGERFQTWAPAKSIRQHRQMETV